MGLPETISEPNCWKLGQSDRYYHHRSILIRGYSTTTIVIMMSVYCDVPDVYSWD